MMYNDDTQWAGGTPNFYGGGSPTMAWGGESGGYSSPVPKNFSLDSIYGSRDPNQIISGQTGMPTTRATAQATSPYTPAKGVWQDFDNQYMGDYQGQDTRQPWEKGYWKPDPNANYGTSPGQNFGQMFDPKTGDHIGWMEKGDLSAGGSGLFGSFGKEKSLVQYMIDPATGQLMDPGKATVTPSKSGMTNFMSYAVPIGMAAGLGAGAAGGAFSGTAAAGGELGTGSGLVELGGGGAGFTGSTAATGGATALSQLPGASMLGGSGGLTELLTKYGPKVLGALTQAGGGGGQGGQGGQGGGMGILDMLGAYYSSQQMKDMSGNLKGIYSDLNNRQDQFRNPLLQSYQDGGKSFYDSNQWKGLESVYQNSIDRGAAKGGTLANPTDRERLLQSYAMKELENYRDGLRQSAGMTKPEDALGPLAEGYKAEAYANTAPFAAYARGGTGANVGQVWNTIKDTASTAEDVWKFISSWFD